MATPISEHFTLEEFTYSDTAVSMGIDNTPPPEEMACLEILADVMEQVRSLLDDCPIIISSGYRCPAVNEATGGSETSAHMEGLACDFTCPEFGTPLEICAVLEPYLQELGVDQLIYEFDSWVHLGLTAGDPRCECLTINEQGTTVGLA